jgi:peptide deformylase
LGQRLQIATLLLVWAFWIVAIYTLPQINDFHDERASGQILKPQPFNMSIRTLLRMGDPRLLESARPVDDVFDPIVRVLIEDMFDTMHSAGGVGLAAPQIGVDLQVVIFGFGRSERYPEAEPIPETILINPIITPLGEDEALGWEGCLSVPGLRGEVPRYQTVRYQGLDEAGQPIERTVEGFHARVVQHECDHLQGRLFPMRVRDFRRFGFTDILFPELSQ